MSQTKIFLKQIQIIQKSLKEKIKNDKILLPTNISIELSAIFNKASLLSRIIFYLSRKQKIWYRKEALKNKLLNRIKKALKIL